jgi:methionyl-tRNA formyltransferase
MRVVFMGTSVFAVPSLEALLSARHPVVGVFTQPDRPAGRGRKLRASPVKESAASLGLDVHQPDSLETEGVVELFTRLDPELVVVVAYGKIIPRWLRELPIHGVVNVHGSLLPRYRGAAPVNWAIANGDSESGVCTMQIDAGLDTGAVYQSEKTAIGENETASELYPRLAAIGAPLLIRTLEAIGQGTVVAEVQDRTLATHAPRLRKIDGHIRWDEPARTIHNKVRAFVPWPSVVVRFRQTPCRILRTNLIDDVFSEDPESGTIRIESDRLIVRCGDGRFIEISELQLENRKAVSGRDFIHGARCKNGESFTAFESV